MTDARRTAIYMWDGAGLNVLIPKRRGSGYLRVPYGHHSIEALNSIGYQEGVDMCGLDGYLNLEYRKYLDTKERAETVARIMPKLAQFYQFTDWKEDRKAFWAVLLPVTQ